MASARQEQKRLETLALNSSARVTPGSTPASWAFTAS